jgi:hypothetical protein
VGRISGRPWGFPVAAYGENLMATHTQLRGGHGVGRGELQDRSPPTHESSPVDRPDDLGHRDREALPGTTITAGRDDMEQCDAAARAHRRCPHRNTGGHEAVPAQRARPVTSARLRPMRLLAHARRQTRNLRVGGGRPRLPNCSELRFGMNSGVAPGADGAARRSLPIAPLVLRETLFFSSSDRRARGRRRAWLLGDRGGEPRPDSARAGRALRRRKGHASRDAALARAIVALLVLLSVRLGVATASCVGQLNGGSPRLVDLARCPTCRRTSRRADKVHSAKATAGECAARAVTRKRAKGRFHRPPDRTRGGPRKVFTVAAQQGTSPHASANSSSTAPECLPIEMEMPICGRPAVGRIHNLICRTLPTKNRRNCVTQRARLREGPITVADDPLDRIPPPSRIRREIIRHLDDVGASSVFGDFAQCFGKSATPADEDRRTPAKSLKRHQTESLRARWHKDNRRSQQVARYDVAVRHILAYDDIPSMEMTLRCQVLMEVFPRHRGRRRATAARA